MRRIIAIILFVLFNLGAFGVTIKQHLCCHAQQAESNMSHCSDDESCCSDDTNECADCCDEIEQTIKTDENFTSQDLKINFDLEIYALPASHKWYTPFLPADLLIKKTNTNNYYFPPAQNLQILYSSFLI